MPEPGGFVRVVGDGLVVEGSCVLLAYLWRCDKNNHTCAIYDGLDVTQGKLFAELIGRADTYYPFSFGDGVAFDSGLYVDQTNTDDALTVIFRQVE